jgi:hypothetical protein
VLGLVSACSEFESTAYLQNPIIDGTQSAFAQVVATISPKMMCSGTVIAPDLVLTAHHCVSSALGPEDCDPDWRPGSGAALLFPVYKASDLAVDRNPSYQRDHLTVIALHTLEDFANRPICGNDLSVLQLAKPLDIKPVPIRTSPPLVGETLTVIGYGLTDPDTISSSGHRMGRAGVKITKVGRTKHEDGRWRTVDGDFVVDIGPCPGDSGGPALDQDGKLIGVMSRGHESTCTEMIYTRVDHHATWLTGLIEASLQRNQMHPRVDSGKGSLDAGIDSAPLDSSNGDAIAPSHSKGCALASHTHADNGGVVFLAWLLVTISMRTRRRFLGAAPFPRSNETPT